MSVNKVILVGRLGADPNSRATSGGKSLTTFSLATSKKWYSDGEKREKTEWHKVVAWNALADRVGKYLAKGSQVYVEGRLQTRSWEDASGHKRYSTQIVAETVQFLGRSKDGPSAPSEYTEEELEQLAEEAQFQELEENYSDEEIPF